MERQFKNLLVKLLILGFCAVLALTGCKTAHGPSDDNKGGASYPTITFVDEQGNTLGTQTVSSTGSVDFDYKKDGYKCSFFNSDGVQVYSGQFTTKTDCKITVKFTPITYTATFITEHGTAPAPLTWTYSDSYYGANIRIDSGVYVLTASGYSFDGWYKDGDSYKTTYINKHYDTKDITLTAKWTPWTATIHYDRNAPASISVSGSMYDDQFSYGTAKNLSKNKYFANGYKFTGWNAKANGTGTAYADEASFTWSGSANNENITLYAQWKKLQTSIDISVVTPPTHSDISLTYDATGKHFKAELAGASTFKWYIDGVAVENETGATLSAYALSAGHHSVMVTTELAGRKYGTTLSVTVTVN